MCFDFQKPAMDDDDIRSTKTVEEHWYDDNESGR